MRRRNLHPGLTLIELLVVISVMAILMAIAVPAVKAIMDSFDSTTGVRQYINAALSSARAIAVREQTYAGVRFQQDQLGDTYMVFVVHDETATGLANGFRALPGRKPMKLPQDVGVATAHSVNRIVFYTGGYQWDDLVQVTLTDAVLADNSLYMSTIAGKERNIYYLDASTFSVIFSPQGKLVTHPVWIRSNDAIFNLYDTNNQRYLGQFLQDDYGQTPDNYGIGPEMSVQSFMLYSKKNYAGVPHNLRWTNCLSKSTTEYISPYTGELMIEYRNAQNP